MPSAHFGKGLTLNIRDLNDEGEARSRLHYAAGRPPAMLTALRNALPGLLKSALPGSFEGVAQTVSLEIPIRGWAPSPLPPDPIAGEAAPEEALDSFEIDSSLPAGPITLSRPPLPGSRQGTLLSSEGERLSLPPEALVWSSEDSGICVVDPRFLPSHFGKGRLEIAYTIAVVSTRILAIHELAIRLSAPDPEALERAETLILAWSALNQETMRSAGGYSLTSGDYRAEVLLRGIRPMGSSGPAPDTRELLFEVEVELRAVRNRSELGQRIRVIESREDLR